MSNFHPYVYVYQTSWKMFRISPETMLKTDSMDRRRDDVRQFERDLEVIAEMEYKLGDETIYEV
jgi:hypothetical protein